MSDEVRYGVDYWRDALEAAEIHEWDPVDAGEKHGPLAQWLCDDVIDREQVDRDPEVIAAAIKALEMQGHTEFGAELLVTVIQSHRENFREDDEGVHVLGRDGWTPHWFDTGKW